MRRTFPLVCLVVGLATLMAGTAAAATITGTGGPDVIIGTDANDNINSRGGADYVAGRDGADVIIGEAGHDTLIGDDDRDGIYGRRGNDVIWGNEERAHPYAISDLGDLDHLFGGPGDDIIHAVDQTKDHVYCGTGNDTAWVDAADETEGCETENIIAS